MLAREAGVLTSEAEAERAEVLSMQSRVDLAGDAAWEAWHGLELFEGGVQERLGSAEVIQDLLLARRPDAGSSSRTEAVMACPRSLR